MPALIGLDNLSLRQGAMMGAEVYYRQGVRAWPRRTLV